MSPAGSAKPSGHRDALLAANPSADIFKKLRLVGSLDTQFYWQECGPLSIVRMILNYIGSRNESQLELPQRVRRLLAAVHMCGGANQHSAY
jgi:hypothetical protein